MAQNEVPVDFPISAFITGVNGRLLWDQFFEVFDRPGTPEHWKRISILPKSVCRHSGMFWVDCVAQNEVPVDFPISAFITGVNGRLLWDQFFEVFDHPGTPEHWRHIVNLPKSVWRHS